MTHEVRPVDRSDADAFHRATWQAFGGIPDEEALASGAERFEPDFALAVFDQGRIVATASAYPLEIAAPRGRAAVPHHAGSRDHRRRCSCRPTAVKACCRA